MDISVKNLIDLKKKSILDYYEINDNNLLFEIEDLFEEMYVLGELSSNVLDFEYQLLNSPLNEKYRVFVSRLSITCSIRKDFDKNMYMDEDIIKEVNDDLEFQEAKKEFLETKSNEKIENENVEEIENEKQFKDEQEDKIEDDERKKLKESNNKNIVNFNKFLKIRNKNENEKKLDK